MFRQRFAVIGAGALGGLYGGMLARAGNEVHFLLRSDADHVRQNGLKVDSPKGDFHLPSVHVYDRADQLPSCEITLLGLKTTENHLLETLLPPPTRDGGSVLVLQNGLDVEAATARIVGVERTLGGCCFLCSNKIGPGHIHHLDYGRIVLGRYVPEDCPVPGVDPLVASLCQTLKRAQIDVVPVADLWLARWRKLMWNIPFNGLSVILNASTKTLIENEHTEALAKALMHEVATISAAYGRHQPSDSIEITLDHTRKMVPYDSSMRLDAISGRAMEIESIFGNPFRAAVAKGIETPCLQVLYQQLCFLQAERERV